MSEMAVGIPIGIAVGISTGIATGRKQAAQKIQNKINDYAATRGITIIDSSGKEISLEQFASEIFGEEDQWPAWRIWAVVIGLGVFLAAALIYYFTIKAN